MAIEIPLSKRGKYAGLHVAIVDDIDGDLAKLNWIVFHNHNQNLSMYARRKPSVSMHRVIMERMLGRPLEKGELVDHRNNNGLDNRRENLRLATPRQNTANRRVGRNNKLGVKGVRKYKKRYIARIRFNDQLIRLGSFATAEEASAAYEAKAKELFGEFARKS